ncbi:MAG: carboxymuconolactone decarboxylase family protein, partial [Myxococcales bacterium]
MTTPKQRLSSQKVAPDAFRAMLALEEYVRSTGLEPALLHLVKLRASYINGCAHCIDMHTKDARAQGETEQRIYAIPVWRETPFFTERERAALAWTEAVTELGRAGVSDELFQATREHFSERDLVDLT